MFLAELVLVMPAPSYFSPFKSLLHSYQLRVCQVSFTESFTFFNSCSARDGWVSVFLEGQVIFLSQLCWLLLTVRIFGAWCFLGFWLWQQVIQVCHFNPLPPGGIVFFHQSPYFSGFIFCEPCSATTLLCNVIVICPLCCNCSTFLGDDK